MFGGGDDDDLAGAVPKRKLVKLDEEDAAKDESDEAEDKKRIIKSLIERIPTAKEELFAYSLDWSIVDQVCEFCSAYVLFQVEIVALFAPLGRHSSGTCKRIIACSDYYCINQCVRYCINALFGLCCQRV